MAYDEDLAARLRAHFQYRDDVVEKKMFGGLCFMVAGHMCCGIVDRTLMARVGPDNYEECLGQQHVRKMDFTGKPLRGLVYVDPAGLHSEEQLIRWAVICTAFVESLPPRLAKP